MAFAFWCGLHDCIYLISPLLTEWLILIFLHHCWLIAFHRSEQRLLQDGPKNPVTLHEPSEQSV